MTANLLDENRVSMTELARQLGVTISTIWRWGQRGVRGVKLETFMLGGRRYTTQEAHRRFVEATTLAADGLQRCAGVYGPKLGDHTMNCITNSAIATAQPTVIVTRPKELSLRIARQQRKVLRTSGQEQDAALGKLIALYQKRAAAFDRGAE